MTQPQTATVTLETAITRGEQTISEVTLRKPMGGDLRGLSVQDLTKSEYNAIRTLVPRIATPQILESDIDAMGADDIAAFAGEILGFFMTASQKNAVHQFLGVTPETSSD